VGEDSRRSVPDGAGGRYWRHAPIVVRFSCGGEFGVVVGEGPAFIGVDSGGGDILLVLGGWFQRVFLVELADDVW